MDSRDLFPWILKSRDPNQRRRHPLSPPAVVIRYSAGRNGPTVYIISSRLSPITKRNAIISALPYVAVAVPY
jgi:hypothetical protein